MNKKFDAFISHSSNDKRYFVRPLTISLTDYGAKIWYDEFSLRPGMSLSRSIEKGLIDSKFGLVVLSQSFFEKKWTKYELSALNSFEVNNPGVIIPIWYKVDENEVRQFSPYLSDKLAIVYTDKTTIDEIAIQILEVIREDIFEQVHQKKIWQELLKKATPNKLEKDSLSKLKIGPLRHKEFPFDWITRIRLIRSMLFEVNPHSMEFWLEGFQRDIHPEDEIHIWERIATIYKESIDVLKLKSSIKKREAFKMIVGRTLENKVEKLNIEGLSKKEIETIEVIVTYPIGNSGQTDHPSPF